MKKNKKWRVSEMFLLSECCFRLLLTSGATGGLVAEADGLGDAVLVP